MKINPWCAYAGIVARHLGRLKISIEPGQKTPSLQGENQ